MPVSCSMQATLNFDAVGRRGAKVKGCKPPAPFCDSLQHRRIEFFANWHTARNKNKQKLSHFSCEPLCEAPAWGRSGGIKGPPGERSRTRQISQKFLHALFNPTVRIKSPPAKNQSKS